MQLFMTLIGSTALSKLCIYLNYLVSCHYPFRLDCYQTSNSHSLTYLTYTPWVLSIPLVSMTGFTTYLYAFLCLAISVKLWQLVPYQSVMFSTLSCLGLPRLLLPSMIPVTDSLCETAVLPFSNMTKKSSCVSRAP